MVESVQTWRDIYFEQLDFSDIIADLGLLSDGETYETVGGGDDDGFISGGSGGHHVLKCGDIGLPELGEIAAESEIPDYGDLLDDFIRNFYTSATINDKLASKIKTPEQGWYSALLSIFDETSKGDNRVHARIFYDMVDFMELARKPHWKAAIWGLENIAGVERDIVLNTYISNSMKLLYHTAYGRNPPSIELLHPEDLIVDLGMVDVSSITSYLLSPEGYPSFAFSQINQNFMANIEVINYFLNEILNNKEEKDKFTIKYPAFGEEDGKEQLGFWFDANPADFGLEEDTDATAIFRPDIAIRQKKTLIQIGNKKYAQLMTSRTNVDGSIQIIPTGLWYHISPKDTKTGRYRFELGLQLANNYGVNAVPSELIESIRNNEFDPDLVWLFVRNGPFYSAMFIEGGSSKSTYGWDNIFGEGAVSEDGREQVKWVKITLDGLPEQEIPIPKSKYDEFSLLNAEKNGKWTSATLLRFLPYAGPDGIFKMIGSDGKPTLIAQALNEFFKEKSFDKGSELYVAGVATLLDYVRGFEKVEFEGESAQMKVVDSPKESDGCYALYAKIPPLAIEVATGSADKEIVELRPELYLHTLIPTLETFLAQQRFMLINLLSKSTFSSIEKEKELEYDHLKNALVRFRNLLCLITGKLV
ncbi:MAG: hypothetical protein ACFFDI_29970 [Promethearchaeota archaeon]